MKKLLAFVLMFLSAFTVLKTIQGSDFNFYDYIKNVSVELEDLSPPTVNISRLKSLNEIKNKTIGYVFIDVYNEFTQISIDDGRHYIEFEGNIYYTESLKFDGDYISAIVPKVYTSEEYENLPSFIKELMTYYYEYNSENFLDTITYTFEFIMQPIKILWELLVLLFNYLIYFIQVLFIIGGGLLL